MSSEVIVLNADMSYHQTVHWQDAICMLIKGVAKPLVNSSRVVRSVSMEFVVPKVIQLVKYIRARYKKALPFRKRIVFLRDGYKCQYCGKGLTDHTATLDHVQPRFYGGKASYENCVTACRVCNVKKGGRTPAEAHMHMLNQPYQPTIGEYLHMIGKAQNILELLKGIA